MENLFQNHPINKNSHPDAMIMFHAFHQADERRKKRLKKPMQVNRPHHFSHPPYDVKITGTGAPVAPGMGSGTVGGPA